MKEIIIKTPAKINLTLEVLDKRPDGFHNIQSIMQAISLYDILSFKIEKSSDFKIELKGNSNQISYDEKNLVYKAAVEYLNKINTKNISIYINIEKNIPVSAGLAGGSSNAAGTIFALNTLFNNFLNNAELNSLCAKLGSDVNFCLNGGCALCTSRGEIIEKIPAFIQKISLIKPKNIGINTKEAYNKFSLLKDKSNPDNTTKLKQLLLKNQFDEKLLYNSLEKAILPSYKELQNIKDKIKGSIMSGSGSTFFVLSDYIEKNIDRKNYEIFENLKTVNDGIIILK